ncbi:MAG: TetR/AcrR family transcriptional regulator [Pseudomonadota bacterium]
MPQDPQTKATYHHGNLPDALIEEGARLLAEGGTDAFSLRTLAKRTGVTVAAPSHHFGNARGLLTAIATRAFEKLALQMDVAASSAEPPQDAVLAMCLAYFEMRTTEPGYASVMFRLDLINPNDAHFRKSAYHAFGLLEEMLTRAVPITVGAAEISTIAKALWATTQGLTTLPMIEQNEMEQIIRSSVAAHLNQPQ